ncbi:MAG: ABC-2 type transport system permease protein [Saprospiraceae bacterium]|jgi:ABC-2 type transport system permease protein
MKGVNLIAFKTLSRKEVVRFLRIWQQAIVPSVITTTLYFVIFGDLIGSRIGEMEGFSYMNFIVPGLILMAVITNSYANVASSFFSSKFQLSIEELLVSPTSDWVILLGYVAGGVARGICVGIVVTIVSLFFSELQIYSYPVLISVTVLTSVLFSLGGFTNGMLAKKFDDISIVPTFILTPLTYLGGVFYSIKLLPEFWQVVSHLNPILYMISAFRYGFLGISDISLWVSYLIIIGFIIALAIANLVMIKKGYGLRS